MGWQASVSSTLSIMILEKFILIFFIVRMTSGRSFKLGMKAEFIVLPDFPYIPA